MAVLEPGKFVNKETLEKDEKDLKNSENKNEEWLNEKSDKPEIKGSTIFIPNENEN